MDKQKKLSFSLPSKPRRPRPLPRPAAAADEDAPASRSAPARHFVTEFDPAQALYPRHAAGPRHRAAPQLHQVPHPPPPNQAFLAPRLRRRRRHLLRAHPTRRGCRKGIGKDDLTSATSPRLRRRTRGA
ncbi:hypothetical protein ACP4OV_029510 [Aristida adscensionis]